MRKALLFLVLAGSLSAAGCATPSTGDCGGCAPATRACWTWSPDACNTWDWYVPNDMIEGRERLKGSPCAPVSDCSVPR